MTLPEKSARLAQAVDWSHPFLADMPAAFRTAGDFVGRLAAAPARPWRFEYGRKAEMLDFLRAHYEGWRKYVPSAADRLAAFTIEQARGPRALSGVIALGQAWWATGDPRYGAAFQRFYTAVPTGDMLNWDAFTAAQVGIELDPWFLLQDCPGFTPEGRIAFLDHLEHAAGFAWDACTSQWSMLGLGPEGHNWYLHGTQGLPLFGLVLPEFKRSAFLLKTAVGVFEENLRAQYRSDGGARETAPHYQYGSVLALWDVYTVLRRHGHPLMDGYAGKVLELTRWLLKLASPSGGCPAFGDSYHEPGDLTIVAAVAAALTGDPVCKGLAERWRKERRNGRAEKAGALPECAFWRVGLEGAEAYRKIRARPPGWISVLLPAGGFAAMRAGPDAAGPYMAVIAAERGPIVTSHGHTDFFSLDVHADGIRFLGEPGHAVYGNTPGRDYDCRAEAHNTLVIRGEEPLPMAGEWRWRGQVRPAVTRWISTPSHDLFEAAHEGFYRYPERQTLVWRKIFFRKPAEAGEAGWWLVIDRVESQTENDWVAFFHGCVPGRIEGGTVWLGEAAGTRLALTAPAEDGLAWEEVESEGLTAFRRERKLESAMTPVFSTGRRMKSGTFVWGLIPVRPGAEAPSLRRLAVTVNGHDAVPEEATVVEVQANGRREIVALYHRPHNVELACAGLSGWGMFWHAVAENGGAPAVRARHTTADGACGV